VVDPSRSRVWIDARSSLHPIHSESDGLEGWVEAGDDGAPVTAGEVALPVEALSSGNPLYDREMRRRAEARRYPTITGRLTAIEPTGRDGRYRVSGEVTFRGVSRPYEDEMDVRRDGTTIELEGERAFDIRDFGMDPPKILTLRVYPDVSVRVRIVASGDGKGA
jgi:polyisoprenoid-binding protein YceI